MQKRYVECLKRLIVRLKRPGYNWPTINELGFIEHYFVREASGITQQEMTAAMRQQYNATQKTRGPVKHEMLPPPGHRYG